MTIPSTSTIGGHAPAYGARRILLPEGSSLSAREAIAALGPLGYHIDVCDPNPLCIGRFSRFVHRVYRSPVLGHDPVGYLRFVLRLLSSTRYDVLLPIHEQAFLFARAAAQLSRHVGLAVAAFDAFEQVQSKVSFIGLLDELHLPHPPTRLIRQRRELEQAASFPYYVKTAYGTAGSGTWRVTNAAERAAVIDQLDRYGRFDQETAILVQDVAPGVLEVVQSVFDRGRLVAAHCYQQQAEGVGGSASARVSVHRPLVREHLAQLGQRLSWHGSLMIDYLYDARSGRVAYIDPNPRLGETMNATLSGVNLADLVVRLSLGEAPEAQPAPQAGVRSHILLAVLLGIAERGGTRRDILRELGMALARKGRYTRSEEECARAREDVLSIIPLMMVCAQLLVAPQRGRQVATRAIENYALTTQAAHQIHGLAGEVT